MQEEPITTLAILVNTEELYTLDLSHFPYLDDQFQDGIEDDQNSTDFHRVWIYINLDGRDDLTLAQEMYLNTHPAVLMYDLV